jgi:formiminotetrahydrofolate cyclodeaminase
VSVCLTTHFMSEFTKLVAMESGTGGGGSTQKLSGKFNFGQW